MGTLASPPGKGLPSTARPRPSTTPEQRRTHPHGERRARGLHRVVLPHAGQLAKRDRDGLPLVEADHLRGQRLAATLQQHDVADARPCSASGIASSRTP